jgi:hypothetical protein
LASSLAVLLAVGLAPTGEVPRREAGPGQDILEACAATATPDCDLAALGTVSAEQQAAHLTALGVDRWHAAGHRGKGVTIAVLDSGFRGYRAHLGRALPARVVARSFRADGDLEARNSQHGIWCAAVLHTLAPDAELLLANWEDDQPETFLAAARWARQQGAHIISCSVIMPSWSDGEGGGPVHEKLAHTLGSGHEPGDVLCFASAGNIAQRHWSGLFRDGGDGFHEWRPGHKDDLLTPWGDDRVAVELCWRPGPNYDLLVWDETTGSVAGESLSRRGARRCCAVVHLHPAAGHRYHVRVRLAHGKAGSFHLAVLGGGLACATPRGSIACPADGSEVIAVGAVDHHGRRACYSSCGPNSRDPKPDLVAPVPFPGVWRNRPFTGTSAAAPQAAALAALWWSRYPRWTAEQVRTALRTTARDLGPPGHDWETGYGLVTLPK